MKSNVLESLKEKKRIVKLSMTALVGAASLYAGAALCGAHATFASPGSSQKVQDVHTEEGTLAPINGTDVQGAGANASQTNGDTTESIENSEPELAEAASAAAATVGVSDVYYKVCDVINNDGGTDEDKIEVLRKLLKDEDDDIIRELKLSLVHENRQKGLELVCRVENSKGRSEAEEREIELNERALDLGLPVEDENGWTELHKAVKRGDLELVKRLVDNGADVGAIDKSGYTPLQIAISSCDLVTTDDSHLAIAKFLIDQSSEIKDENKVKGASVLHYAVLIGDKELIEKLIDKGADVEFELYGDTPLMFAAEMGKWNVVNIFLDRASEAVIKKVRYTLLDRASAKGGLETVKCLVDEHSADINAGGREGRTPLHLAAENGRIEVVKYLIDRGATVDIRAQYGRTPLHFAAENGQIEVVKYLVDEKKVDFNRSNFLLDTPSPLHLAAANGQIEVVKYLVGEKGADINAYAGGGYGKPVDLAAERGQIEVVKYLVGEKGAGTINGAPDKRLLHFAAAKGHLDVVKYLVGEKGADINAKDEDGYTPLHFAAAKGHLDVVEYLVDEKGVDINAKDKHGLTPLHEAVSKGCTNVVEVLLTADGVNVNAEDKNGSTPLHLAAKRDYKNIVKVLLTADGVNVNAKDKNGSTPLHLAAKRHYKNIVKVLLTVDGVDVNAKDKRGMTPLHLAASRNYKYTIKVLLTADGIDVNAEDNNGSTPLNLVKRDCAVGQDCCKLLENKMNGLMDDDTYCSGSESDYSSCWWYSDDDMYSDSDESSF